MRKAKNWRPPVIHHPDMKFLCPSTPTQHAMVFAGVCGFGFGVSADVLPLQGKAMNEECDFLLEGGTGAVMNSVMP